MEREDIGVVTTVIEVQKEVREVRRPPTSRTASVPAAGVRGAELKWADPLNKDTRWHLAGRPAQQHRHPGSATISTTSSVWTSSMRRSPPPTSRAAIGGVRALGNSRVFGVHTVQGGRARSGRRVEALGAGDPLVNTVVNDGGVLSASNTDYIAVQRLIVEHHLDPARSVLIHGMAEWPRRLVRPSGTTDSMTTASWSPATDHRRSRAADQLGYHWRPHAGVRRRRSW